MVVLASSLFLADVTAAYTRQLQQKLHLVLVNAVTVQVDLAVGQVSDYVTTQASRLRGREFLKTGAELARDSRTVSGPNREFVHRARPGGEIGT